MAAPGRGPAVIDAVRAEKAGNAAAAMAIYARILDGSPAHREALSAFARLAFKTGSPAAALAASERAVRANPGSAEAWTVRAMSLAAIGGGPGGPGGGGGGGEALACLQRAVSLEPMVPARRVALSRALAASGRLREASAALEDALTFMPADPELRGEYGEVCAQLGRLDAARQHLEFAAARLKRPIDLTRLGLLLRNLGQTARAVECFDAAIRTDASFTAALTAKADVLIAKRRHDEAMELCRTHERLAGPDAHASALMARIHAANGDKPAAETELNRYIADPRWHRTPPMARAPLLFQLGALLEERGATDDAFARYAQARACFERAYDPAREEARIDELIRVFSRDNLRRFARGPADERTPVFILGMPRSGTSLIEQVLASHPRVFGAGELDAVGRMVYRLETLCAGAVPAASAPGSGAADPARFPAVMHRLTHEAACTLSAEYVSHVRALARADGRGGEGDEHTLQRITDKMPHNFMLLGLINTILPGARVIHCTRDPLDNCFSIFATSIIASHAFACDLAWIGHAYRQYRRLMAHYTSVADIPILDVAYERTVAEPEAMARRIIDFVGLEWDDRVMRFHENRRITRTASQDQVVKPIYDSSIGRAMRFRRHLDPLVAALGDVLA